jgi:hypothetical protein
VAREGALKPAVAVLKMRGSSHDSALHELLIDAPHLAVGPRLAEVGPLGGDATRVAHVVRDGH